MLYDAASQIQLINKRRLGVPLNITPDGHRIAYLSKKSMRFVAWDLPTAQQKAISPRLDARTEELILREARKLVRLGDATVSERWHGIYPLHRDQPVFSRDVEPNIHVITAIGGKGMTTGPALARESIDRVMNS